MKKILWLDCANGCAGDMLAAALLDAGGNRMAMERALASLPIEGFSICVSHRSVAGIRCCDFDVVLDEHLATHDHDMDYLYGHLDEPPATHEHHHEHDHGHHHEHRSLGEVLEIIQGAELPEGARSLAERAFFILADAEAEAHGAERETVKFHEVGAIDSIVDVVACASLVDSLGPDAVALTHLTDGQGRVRTAHGVLAVPVPAVASIVGAYRLPLAISEREGELITPTGAAVLAALNPTFAVPCPLTVHATGYGAGKRAYPWPNYLRAVVGSVDEAEDATILKLECDIDDITGEAMGAVVERLMAAGAHEAHWIALGTKKGRPSWQLQVIAKAEDREALELVIFRDTTTIGIRRQTMERTVLPREEVMLELELGGEAGTVPLRAKRVTLPDGTLRTMPEADDVAAISAAHGLSLQAVWQKAMAACAQTPEGEA